jgi:hypothetical protein
VARLKTTRTKQSFTAAQSSKSKHNKIAQRWPVHPDA